jgi:hypothetical protein
MPQKEPVAGVVRLSASSVLIVREGLGILSQESNPRMRRLNYVVVQQSSCVPKGRQDGSLARSAWKTEPIDPSRRVRSEVMALACNLEYAVSGAKT